MICDYCNREIIGRRYFYERFKNSEIVPVVTEDPDPKDFVSKRYNICKECLDDMGIKVQD